MDKERLPKKIRLVFFLVSLLLLLTSFLFAKDSVAANAVPFPGRINCDVTRDPEYASDRPYQASICGDRPITYWCGNDVVINLGTVRVPYCDPRGGEATECPCKTNCERDQKIDVDLTDVELPILGNTELTKNSTSNDDQLDDGTKTSNYVAWYLGGTNSRAEYGYDDPTTKEGVSKIVDTSGPLKKLLPSIIQDAIRIQTINTASTEITYTTDPENELNTTGQQVTENENHNQIVVCYTKPVSILPSWLTNFLGTGAVGLGKAMPQDCYDRSESPNRGSVLRLKNWDDTPFDVAISEIQDWILDHHLYPPGYISDIIANALIDHWPKKYPPLPWSDKNGEPFKTAQDYQKAYNEWRGQLCMFIDVPIIGRQLVCLGIPGVTNNDYADLYQYVPLANTVDKKGSHMVTNTHITAPRATLEDVSYEIFHSPQLYLAHSLENFQLSDSLKKTYKPKESEEGSEATIPNDVERNTQCRIVPSRTNPGDDATFENPQSHIEVDVHYTITMIQCTTPVYECGTRGRGDDGPEVCRWTANCSSDVYATVNTVGKFAYNYEIWNNTVAGSDSIFRRIYPKTGAGSPVTCIADTPASSNATYTLNDNSSPGLELLRVQEPDKTSVKSEDGKTVKAQLYYPHYGGVLDYFLNGIQQALRPLGYGPGQPTDGQFCDNVSCGELPDLPKASGSCQLGGTGGINIPQSFKDIISAAAETYKVSPSLILGIMYGEGAFNPGRYNWTDQNVKNWATCQPLPNCSPGSGTINSIVPFFSGYWNTLAQQILPDLQKIDPTKTQADPCNLLDATFALAKDLHTGAGGSPSLTGKHCLGINMSSTIPASCSWSDSQLETAIRVWEFGTQWGNTSNGLLTCATKENSCLTGGGTNAQCPTDTASNYDTCDNSVGANSHNACVYDIAKGK